MRRPPPGVEQGGSAEAAAVRAKGTPTGGRHGIGNVAAAWLVAALTLAGLSACATNPHTPDIAAPSQAEPAASGSHHTPGHVGVQLPSTLSMSYDHPMIMDVPHQVVLWDVSQAIKAEFAAMYEKTSGTTPDLARYWTGEGYKAALANADAWIAAKEQPVGRIVITGTTVEKLTAPQATVTFCQDLSMVRKGIERTNQIQSPVQAAEADGDRLTFTLTPTGPRGTWQVSSVTTVKQSAQCPPLDDAHKARHR